MTPQTLISRLDAAIAGYGQTRHLAAHRGRSGDRRQRPFPNRSRSPAAVSNFGPQSLESGESQEIRVVLSPTGLGSFGVPSRDDIILIDGSPSQHHRDRAAVNYGGAAVPREPALPWLIPARGRSCRVWRRCARSVSGVAAVDAQRARRAVATPGPPSSSRTASRR
jgi:hypothetical protein